MYILKLSNVVVYRRGYPMFAPTTFQAHAGECILITGDNGVGKTTLLEAIAGTYFDYSGNLQVRTSKRSYLRQGDDFITTLTLGETARLIVGFDQNRYARLLALFGLKDQEQTLLSVISGGEAQKARILLALLRDHRLLLLDEPFANLDDVSRTLIAEEISGDADRAVVVVEHTNRAGEIPLRRRVDVELRCAQDSCA